MSSPKAVSDIFNTFDELIHKLLQHHKLPIDTVTEEIRKIISSHKTVEHAAGATFGAKSQPLANEGTEGAQGAEDAEQAENEEDAEDAQESEYATDE